MVATATAHLSHGKSRIVSLEELGSIPAPEGTSTWRPVQHREVVDALHNRLAQVGIDVGSEQFSITKDDRQMFGVMKLQSSQNPEWCRCIGIRNGNDRLLALGIAVGVAVHVCDNRAFAGEHVYHRRHTARFSLDSVIDNAFNGISERFDVFESRLSSLKSEPVSDDAAAGIAVRVAENGGIRAADILTVLAEYRNPRHEEFSDRTLWSLLNAFTEIAKRYRMARYRDCQRVLAEAFSLG